MKAPEKEWVSTEWRREKSPGSFLGIFNSQVEKSGQRKRGKWTECGIIGEEARIFIPKRGSD